MELLINNSNYLTNWRKWNIRSWEAKNLKKREYFGWHRFFVIAGIYNLEVNGLNCGFSGSSFELGLGDPDLYAFLISVTNFD